MSRQSRDFGGVRCDGCGRSIEYLSKQTHAPTCPVNRCERCGELLGAEFQIDHLNHCGRPRAQDAQVGARMCTLVEVAPTQCPGCGGDFDFDVLDVWTEFTREQGISPAGRCNTCNHVFIVDRLDAIPGFDTEDSPSSQVASESH